MNDNKNIVINVSSKVSYIYGVINGYNFEIQFWQTILYHAFEYEHDIIYKPIYPLTDLQISDSKRLRDKEFEIQDLLDKQSY